jgi:hypothetical protein
MSIRFDVFKLYKDGSVLWLGTAEDLEEAKKRVLPQIEEDGCKFCVRDQKTGGSLTYLPSDLRAEIR